MDRTGTALRPAQPTPGHFIPALFVIGTAGPRDDLARFNQGIDPGTVSTRGFGFG